MPICSQTGSIVAGRLSNNHKNIYNLINFHIYNINNSIRFDLNHYYLLANAIYTYLLFPTKKTY